MMLVGPHSSARKPLARYSATWRRARSRLAPPPPPDQSGGQFFMSPRGRFRMSLDRGKVAIRLPVRPPPEEPHDLTPQVYLADSVIVPSCVA
jgi:hypothetical protein